MFHVAGMLRGNNDARNPDGFAILVNHRDLRLCVRPEPAHFAALSNPSEFAPKSVRKHNRRRHQLRRFIARVAEHQPLIPCTLLGGFLAFGGTGIHALSNVRRLLGNHAAHKNSIGMKNIVVMNVTDLAHAIAHDLEVIEFRFRGDLAADDDNIALSVSLARDAAVWILRQTRIEHCVGDCVANFVGVTFSNGFG